MAGEGSEKTWDQCRVKLKNLKSQWRYVKDRIPGIETADLDDEDVVRQLSQECQTRGGELRPPRGASNVILSPWQCLPPASNTSAC